MEISEINKLSLGLKMAETFKLIGRAIAMEIPSHGLDITMEQHILLHLINTIEEATQQDLAKALNKDKSGILRLTDELEKRKMVVRIVDSQDRRKKTLMLTKKGMETLTKMHTIEAAVHEKMLAGVSQADLEVFSKVLSIMHKNVVP